MTRGFRPVQWLDQRQPWDAPQSLRPTGQDMRRDLPTTVPQVEGAPALVGIAEPRRNAKLVSLNVNLPTIATGVQSVRFLDETSAERNLLGFRNASTGTQNLYIDFSTEATAQSWLKLIPGQIILFDTVVPQDDLYAISDAAGGVLAYVYSTILLGT